MGFRTSMSSAAGLLCLFIAAHACAQGRPDGSLPGKAIYDKTCAACHATPPDERTPTFASLAAMPSAQIRDAMREGGKMAPMAAGLSEDEKTQLVAYLTSGQPKTAGNWTETFMCAADKRTVDVSKPIASWGFSIDRNQTRSLTAAQAGLKKDDLKNLEIAWVVGFPGQGSGTGASIVGDTMFLRSRHHLYRIEKKQ